MSETLSPYTADRALFAHLTRSVAFTRNWLLAHHQNSSASSAVYTQTTGLKPAYWPHVLLRKTHNKTRTGAGIFMARSSVDSFEILATVRSDKLADGQTPKKLLEGLHEAIQKDLATFTFSPTQGRVSRPKIINHAIERDYPVDGTTGVTIYELGVEAKFVSS